MSENNIQKTPENNHITPNIQRSIFNLSVFNDSCFHLDSCCNSTGVNCCSSIFYESSRNELKTTGDQLFLYSFPGNEFNELLHLIHHNLFDDWVHFWDNYFDKNKCSGMFSELVYCGDILTYYEKSLKTQIFGNRGYFQDLYSNRVCIPSSGSNGDKLCFKFGDIESTIIKFKNEPK